MEGNKSFEDLVIVTTHIEKGVGIDRGLLLKIMGCKKAFYNINGMKLCDGYLVSVCVEKSPNRDYKKGDKWDINIPCHYNNVEEYFSEKYKLISKK